MGNYTKIVDYAAKDLLLHGDAAKAIKGTEIGAEFDAIATMSATKAELAGSTTQVFNVEAATADDHAVSRVFGDARYAALTGATFTGPVNEARGSVAMHATTMDLWAQSNIIDGTGSAVTITAIANAPQAGARRVLYPIAGTIITNGATFAVDGAANYTTAAGDALEFEAITTSTYKVHITKKNGEPVKTASQIQSISASVGSSALTISASELTLDFRSTTLGDGTVTTVTATPANLVISSGSTLGTINAVPSRVAVLAINNAGTIEIAAVNTSGGVDLTETGLISTIAEGGAGGADSATTIYSTSARTNVAYRIIGYVASTQATAGTWATAPSAIQGAGGNAVSAMGSIGYGQTWQALVGSRSAGTTYRNTTERPIQLGIVVRGTAATSNATLVIDGITVGYYGTTATPAGFSTQLSGIVPPGATYVVTVTNIAIDYWAELR